MFRSQFAEIRDRPIRGCCSGPPHSLHQGVPMLDIDFKLTPADLLPGIHKMWESSGPKLLSIEQNRAANTGTPVFTVDGIYQAQGWTEWTQGFLSGSFLLQFEATDDQQFLDIGRDHVRTHMASHLTHTGVHDHGFNNVSTYGALWRLMNSGRIPENAQERDFCELALKCSGAVQAARWSNTHDDGGYIYSFNGPHSLFCDTIRSLRSLSLAHMLKHALMGENDRRISLLDRMITHALTTARHNVYYGRGRDTYDVRGRVAHESIFNVNDGRYRCPSTQQGYSAFSTWTRGLAWIMCGYPEQLEFLQVVADQELEELGGRTSIENEMLEASQATCDFYIEQTPTDGIPYWDTAAPGLSHMPDHLHQPSDPFNEWEPIDSSAAAIAAQGLLRLGRYLQNSDPSQAERYWQAGLTVLRTLLNPPYLSDDPAHQGLLLHTIYHRPRGWDHVAAGAAIPFGESCMWGDYHLREVCIYLQSLISEGPDYCFFGPSASSE